MHLLYITFGNNLAIHSQAAFSIYSFLAQDEKIDSINVITDAPAYYSHLKDVVRIFLAGKEQLEEWKGPHLFFWRIKIKALQCICKEYTGDPVVYLDTDTFLYKPADHLVKILVKGFALMHEDEGALSNANTKTEKRMWRQIKGRPFANLPMDTQQHMWNAGVVATPNTKGGADCELALRLCDELCAAGVTRKLIEQFALSRALQHTYGLQPAHTAIAHYWSNKEEWNRYITAFFTEAFAKGYSREELIAAMRDFDFTHIPVKKRVRNTSQRLHHIVDRWWGMKEQVYIRHN
ncbi:MAG: hypothetical protein ABR502_06085 [Chitinophagaceae bacterium]